MVGGRAVARPYESPHQRVRQYPLSSLKMRVVQRHLGEALRVRAISAHYTLGIPCAVLGVHQLQAARHMGVKLLLQALVIV